jgi:hypothetical protein
MPKPIQRGAEMQELKCEKSFTAPPKDETNEETSTFIEDPDTMLTMTVLLLACLALAILAHAVI